MMVETMTVPEEHMKKTTSDETRVAEEIVSVVGDAVRLCADERDVVRFAVRRDGFALRTIVFTRAALRKLALDPIRAIKVEYLQRDILRSANRGEYRYPRRNRIAEALRMQRTAVAV
jgi:hypothetical protein